MSGYSVPEAPKVAAILVNWNGWRETIACIESLHQSEVPIWRVYVVDNASSDGSPRRIATSCPRAYVIPSRRNLGYAGAFNLALPVAVRNGADYIWLLNNDTLVARSALGHLLRAAGSVGPALLSPQIRFKDRQDQVWYLGGDLDWRLKTHHLTQESHLPRPAAPGIFPVRWATGCSLFFKAAMGESAGAMDERYFLYLEDVDWCLKARRNGLEVYCVPDALVFHGLSESVKKLDSWHVHYYAWRNYYLFVANHGRWWQKLYANLDLFSRFLKTAVRLLLFPAYRVDAEYLARTQGLIDHIAGRYGQASQVQPSLANLVPVGERPS